MVELVIGVFIVLAIAWAVVANKDELARHQALKNKKRFSGKRLPPEEQEELERLSKKYWWH